MIGLLAAFLSSFIATLAIIRFKHLHEEFSADSDLSGPQKFHKNLVPRIGGISIAIGMLIAILFRMQNITAPIIEITLLACTIPTFAIGLMEDITKKISVRLRLLFTAVAAALLTQLLPVKITSLAIPYLDIVFLVPGISAIFTIFAITGLSNAYNIIDGFNGLASMVGIITLLAISYVSFVVGDTQIMHLSLIMVFAILGFFIWNYPLGLIFLGDGGAYLIGFWIAGLSVLLTYRHHEISPWFAILINGYPIIETLFTIYRRKIHRGKNPSLPDGIHFHTLIYRRVLSQHQKSENSVAANSKTSPYLWFLTLAGIIPALIWWNSTLIMIVACTLFFLVYIWLYKKIVYFKTPKWFQL